MMPLSLGERRGDILALGTVCKVPVSGRVGTNAAGTVFIHAKVSGYFIPQKNV